ncbi:MAG: hypothetical protein P8172_12385 [Gammaproteobacteria bacterium]
MNNSRTRLVTILIASAAAAGCAPSDWLDRDRDVGNVRQSIEGADVSGYLHVMHDLAAEDPATQAETFARVDDAFNRSPTTTNRLRLALALGTPGHAGADAERARRMLTEVLAREELLLPAEVELAELQLEFVDQWLLLTTETRQLETRYQRDADVDRRRLEQQLAGAISENRQLREALTEAEEKLEAITTIERSIRERSDADEQRGNDERP